METLRRDAWKRRGSQEGGGYDAYRHQEAYRGCRDRTDSGRYALRGHEDHITRINPHLTDYVLVFADDEKESNPSTFKFLQMAHAWKQAAGGGGASAFANFSTSDDNSRSPSPSEDEESDEEGDDDKRDADEDSMDSSGEE